eukprot:Protomagalhaensia_wolfi_Nauph_80__3400@NODE_3459_length_793_cov_84_400531_g2718_i0_p2_GENE_NODE_3459_length_793_cov_84_400531_g2718_i0NODE_3459_length_793_cov_84_400531_g2718_i0_p2_ORF_typecomplete_len128_score22_12_NODE_3459_length_793_cov_84_400531_g2718_i0131514
MHGTNQARFGNQNQATKLSQLLIVRIEDHRVDTQIDLAWKEFLCVNLPIHLFPTRAFPGGFLFLRFFLSKVFALDFDQVFRSLLGKLVSTLGPEGVVFDGGFFLPQVLVFESLEGSWFRRRALKGEI